MRVYDYLNGILGALGVGEDNGVPTPSWRIEEYLKAIYDNLKEGGARPTDEQVATAVTDWLDDHPEATTTVQDNSLEISKLTDSAKTKLTNSPFSYNVLNYGVSNENTGDQSSGINSVIALCADGDTVYLPAGRYRITNPIIIDKSINFICDGSIRCVLGSQGYGVVIKKSFVNVKISKIEGLNNNSGCVQIYSNEEAIKHVSLNIDEVASASSAGTDAINITANEYNVLYCTIIGKWFYGALTSRAISFRKLSKTVTIGNIQIYNVLIQHYDVAIYAGDEDLQFGSGNVNSIMAINCGVEGCNVGFHYKDIRSPVILNTRIAEMQAATTIKFEGFCYQGYYNGRTPLKLLSITFVNPKKVAEYSGNQYWYNGFFINAPCYFADNDASPKVFAIIDGGSIYTSPVELTEYTSL